MLFAECNQCQPIIYVFQMLTISFYFSLVTPSHKQLRVTEVTFLSWVKWKLATCLFIKIDNTTHTITRGWLAEVAAETEYSPFPDLSLHCIDRSNGLTDQYRSVWRGKRDAPFCWQSIIRELRWTLQKKTPLRTDGTGARGRKGIQVWSYRKSFFTFCLPFL